MRRQPLLFSMLIDRTDSDVVIIGGVACGPKTAATLARRDKSLSITIFQKEAEISYGTCGMPYFASGDIPSFAELTQTSYNVARDVDFFKTYKGFDVITESEVVAIDRQKRQVTVRDLKSGTENQHGYSSLVIATGAHPNPAPFPVAPSERISTFTRPGDARAFRAMAERGQVGSALIIGGGFIGCELAEATGSMWGIETTLIERESQLLPYILDPEMSGLVEKELVTQDVTVKTGATVEKITLSDDGLPTVHISGSEPVTVDYVFLCLGVRPETDLAKSAGIELGQTGGIVVDDHLRTSDPHIYAGGDCIESLNLISKQKFYIPMGSLANRHGRIIAENICGHENVFRGATGAFFVKVYDVNIGAVGLSELAAGKAGIKARAVWGAFGDKPDYYPEAGTFTVKMVYNIDTRQVVGVQAVGPGDICRRIDSASALMQYGAGLEDFLHFEHGYAPPYSEALDPLHHLAAMALAQERGYNFVAPSIMSDDRPLIVLDVRETSEFEEHALPSNNHRTVVNIPLGQLRERISELNSSDPVYLLCQRGVRSYQGAVILRQNKFSDVHIIGGGYTSEIENRE